MRRLERGFTLIELMVTIAIIGILASIAIPTYMSFVRKSKMSESSLQLDHLAKMVELYHIKTRRLPDSAPLFPPGNACLSPTGKIPAVPQSSWFADPNWAALEFRIDEPTYYRYQWTLVNPTFGTADAIGDLDCDGIFAVNTVQVELLSGNTMETTLTFIDE